jgi:hypothetical protein
MPAGVVCTITSALLGVGDAERVGDALIGGVCLSVDAVRVDLEQHGYAVPDAAGDLGRGHPGVQPQRHRRMPQVIGAAAERRRVLRLGERGLAGLGPDRAVGRVLDDPAPGGLEDPPVRGRPVLLDVGAEQWARSAGSSSDRCDCQQAPAPGLVMSATRARPSAGACPCRRISSSYPSVFGCPGCSPCARCTSGTARTARTARSAARAPPPESGDDHDENQVRALLEHQPTPQD